MRIWEELCVPIQVSGACGSDCTWALNRDAGLLVISGSGAMHTPWEEIEYPDYHDDYNSYNVSPWGSEWGSSMLHTLFIEEGVTEIDARAFENCSALTSVWLPETLEAIAERAFDGCRSLRTLVLPNSLSSLSADRIKGCTELTHLHLGARTKISGVEEGLFIFCGKLTQLMVSAENPYYVCRDGVLYELGERGEPEKLLWCSPAVTGTVHVPDSVHMICAGAFCGCTRLDELHIPCSVTEFGGRLNWRSDPFTVYVEKGSAADVQRERIYAVKTKVRYESGLFGFLHK